MSGFLRNRETSVIGCESHSEESLEQNIKDISLQIQSINCMISDEINVEIKEIYYKLSIIESLQCGISISESAYERLYEKMSIDELKDEKKVLRDKEYQLRDKEYQLRDEKSKLLIIQLNLMNRYNASLNIQKDIGESSAPLVIFENFINASPRNIADNRRCLYDGFTFPLTHDTFIPNQRLRKLLTSVNEYSTENNEINIERTVFELRSGYLWMNTWEYPVGGSETNVTGKNGYLFMNEIINIISHQSDPNLQSFSTLPVVTHGTLPFSPKFTCSNTSTEPRIVLGSHILMGSEFKGVEFSMFAAMPQGFQVCVDSCLYLYRTTDLKYQDCVIPGLIICGHHLYQFYGIYLVADSFPVAVLLSRPLCFMIEEDRRIICKWAHVLASFIIETISMIDKSKKGVTDSKKKTQASSRIMVFKTCDMFFKPIRSHLRMIDYTLSDLNTILHRIMQIYNKLWNYTLIDSHMQDYFLFPIGVMSIASKRIIKIQQKTSSKDSSHLYSDNVQRIDDNIQYDVLKRINDIPNFRTTDWPITTPVIIFDALKSSQGWKNTKPDEVYVQEYLSHLYEIVTILNNSSIAHLDLRPANIMWRIKNDCNLEIKIIDFEDSYIFGEVVLIADMNDPRYPYRIRDSSDSSKLVASCYHNIWFYVAVKSWLDENNVIYDLYDDFMRIQTNYDNVLRTVQDIMNNTTGKFDSDIQVNSFNKLRIS